MSRYQKNNKGYYYPPEELRDYYVYIAPEGNNVSQKKRRGTLSMFALSGFLLGVFSPMFPICGITPAVAVVLCVIGIIRCIKHRQIGIILSIIGIAVGMFVFCGVMVSLQYYLVMKQEGLDFLKIWNR